MLKNTILFLMSVLVLSCTTRTPSEEIEILFRHIDSPWIMNNTSGIAVYENTVLISTPELKQGRFVLKIDEVGSPVGLIVNGISIGTFREAPYTQDITKALKPGVNQLAITSNSDSIGSVDIVIAQKNPLPYTSVKPGQIWLDTNGKPIQAHGFQVIEKDGVYYWYGENKELTTRGSNVWTYGIRCYKSTDFYNWEDCGLIIEPDTVNSLSPLHYSQNLDRPHILYCQHTGKYVCWIKSMDEDGYFVIFQANDLLGPYEYVRSLKPQGYGVGDFDLYADEKTGKGYVWFERPHWELICSELTDDYTDVTVDYSTHFVGLRPPYTREAPTHFVHNGTHFMFTSGTTGYYANLSLITKFADYHGEYIDLGNPHPTDKYNHSFCSQITDVVKIPGKDLYVAVADRWMPQLADTYEPADEAERMIERYKDHEPFPKDFATPTPKNKQNEVRTTWDVTYNATYVFLPIVFKDGVPHIEWKDEWRIEDYQ